MNADEPGLGKIQKVELREAWSNEASDLTPWLAEHPELLADTLGLGDLEVEEIEKSVGNYRADLVLEVKWEDLSTKGACRVAVYKRGCDPTDESDWPAQHKWLADRLNRLHAVLAPRIKVLEPLEDDDADSTDRDPPPS